MGAPMGFPRLHASSLSQASCFTCFVCLGCFRFLDCDFRPRPRRINGTHVTWSHGSSDAWSYQSHVSNPTRDDPLFFRMGRTNRFVFYAPVFNIVEPKKRREHPKLPWPMLSHGHASMLLVIYIHCFDLFCWCEKTLHHCWWTVAKYVAATSLQPRLLLQMFPCKLFAIEGTDSHNGTRQWPTPKCWKVMSAFPA